MDVTDIVSQLRTEEEQRAKKLETLRQQTRKVESELAQIEGALTSLGETTRGKAAKRNRGKSGKPAATKREVIEVISNLVAREPLGLETLKEKAEAVLTGEMEKSRTGFALRFAEAIKDKRFVATESGLQLSSRENGGQ